MPKRQLANSNPKRFRALKAVKDRKDVTAPADVPLTANTITRFDTFFPQYKTKYLAVQTALAGQSILTNQIKTAKITAGYFVADFIDALQNAIRRGTFDASVRALYGLPVGAPHRPPLHTEQEILDWGERVHDGETARIAAGGAPISFPSLADVDGAVGAFKTLNLNQAAAKTVYDNAQEALEAMNEDCDKLILKMWNEMEAAFDEGDKPSVRRKCREWGVVYIPNPGEALSPDDFSLTGKVIDSATGLPLSDVLVHLAEPDIFINTDSHGDYFFGVQTPGSYTVEIHKAGYLDKTIPGVIITAGAITTLNMTMAELAGTGTISGNVNVPGFPPATVSVAGTGLTATTDAMGNFTMTGVAAGSQTVQCFLNSDPANIKTATPTVVAGAVVTVNFSFP